MDEKTSLTTHEIQEAMAERRASLRESLLQMEKEAEKKLLHMLDEVQSKILSASDELTRKVMRPVQLAQEALEKVPLSLQKKPWQTLLVTASVATAMGYLLGRRWRRDRLLTQAMLGAAKAHEQPLIVSTFAPGQKPKRGFLATLAVEIGQQILLNTISTVMRRRN